MGNSACIMIEIENNGSCCGGAKLKGNVLLDVRKATSADILFFHFSGYENTKIDQGESGFSYGSECIYSTQVILRRYHGGSVPRGRYVFPFEVVLPRGLPRSQRSNESCSIAYHCLATLHRSGAPKWIVKNSCEVLMNDEPYAPFPTPMFLGPTSSKVFSMIGSPSGVITFGGRVNTTSVCANEKLRVDYGICNQSTARVKALTIVLMRHITFKTTATSNSMSHEVFKKRVEAANLVGAEPGDVAVDADYDAILKQINDPEFGVDIPINSDALSSYSGPLISVTYWLILSMKTTFGTKNATIWIPIIVHGRGLRFAGADPKAPLRRAMPADWIEIEMQTTVSLREPSLHLAEGYDTVDRLNVIVKKSKEWQKVTVLKDWLAHSPHNINLLTPDTMPPLFQCIESNSNITFHMFCQTLGMAMNDIKSTNKCTTAHIAAAARALPPGTTDQQGTAQLVCCLFAPHCTDRANALKTFKTIGLTDIQRDSVMLHYI